MKKRNLAAGTVLIALLMTGCGQNDEDASKGASTEETAVIPISVDLSVPETGAADENIPLKAVVTQGEEKVDDANEVVYEIWEDGKKEDSWKVESEMTQKGIYEAETKFDHDGQYHVQVHVTARDMHTMPMKEIMIGEGAVGEQAEEGHHGGHDEHAAEGFVMHFMEPENVKAGEPAEMMIHLQQDNKPLEHARVRLEIVLNDKKDEAQWVKLEEDNAGEYVGDATFGDAGTASVTVHVENDEGLHEHETHKVTIAEK
ncbi:hypothetical protein NCCP2716_19960 [Sporosarcina sp. NCCP-2716]|uniref:FixH family protein n=1 Tax=Sporosarcina sp. NCCP-2716 TaxID=2943679 RepID=UPI0020405347|nr:FixH family protein [Sporosarcina sp. NCCP-2716]GKV69498.1 hypothetical protein NCCP2716_19960 [Sporosarcina sp. NCCP-2716]